ncbi:ATP-grasp domain-containing protein [Pseudomaricurvus alkylphenolicus]|uniref:acetyl-CoA carboxylase family protein n=1 Tax=Pseudomaricurvus alkylphenolicus TaxID=1306991 RepID=UPI0014249933|nr:carboxyl transferase domain-containing protein [Pseudomaricurvus alkylphenolicus]NIB39213.1 ATP-grasp domain-containing protein [Pseudomaricurvus alkylphenolicus]
MSFKRLLIANRGEIAIRIAQAAAELGITSVAVAPQDDCHSLHTQRADQCLDLDGRGTTAYLDGDQLLTLARKHNCDAVHPGYGFLSENSGFASACESSGIAFVGPDSGCLRRFGDKAAARELARQQQVPLLDGTRESTTLEQAQAFFASLPPGSGMMIKAIAGGGGRGMRAVNKAEDIADAFERCRSEAQAAFGRRDVYVEQQVVNARHIEIQVLGDGKAAVHFGERDCSLQRRHQKLLEIAPSPSLSAELRQQMCDAALRMAEATRYRGLGTFEFLLDGDRFYFMEANPRVQVEHTVTEMVYGVDLVLAQIQVAAGCSLADLGLQQECIGSPRGFAIQTRINTETLSENGDVVSAAGTIQRYDLPTGPGVRIDSCGYQGFQSSPYYDSLLAKLIVHSPQPTFAQAVAKTSRTIKQLRIEGIATNQWLHCALLQRQELVSNHINTRFIDDHLPELLEAASQWASPTSDSANPTAASSTKKAAPRDCISIKASMQAVVSDIAVMVGQQVLAGQELVVIEAMKMEHQICAPKAGTVREVLVNSGDGVAPDTALIFLEPAVGANAQATDEAHFDLDCIRADLTELQQRQQKTLDQARPDAVAKRHANGLRMARENIADLLDEGSFQEYGSLTIAAQRRRRSVEELIDISPADGLVAGTGSVNGHLFGEEQSRCMVMSYDYTVFAGTQGAMNHKKTDRMLRLANEQKIPLVFFTEGGGGRPGDTDYPVVAGLDIDTWTSIATLSGQVPIVGITAGRCFAGNAALLGCSDVIIATRDANIGMAGPAMIEGGGLGVFDASEVGPSEIQSHNGVIDILVENETEAVAAAKKYLSYFQGPVEQWQAPDKRHLRHAIPENRLRSYDIHQVIESVADENSVLELRPYFGTGIVTSFLRIEGRPFGLIANNSRHLGGAIDAPAADKASRFIKLCDAFDLPLISLCDTPGFMVGPEAEKSAQVRRFSRLFVAAANMTTPLFSIVLRKGYGLGAMAMTGGSFHRGVFTVAWPTGEFGAMGLEGAVRLGFRKELEAVEDPAEKQALFDKLVAKSYERGKAINMASTLEIDEVIDPADTRLWIMRGLKTSAPASQRDGKKLRFVDTW